MLNQTNPKVIRFSLNVSELKLVNIKIVIYLESMKGTKEVLTHQIT